MSNIFEQPDKKLLSFDELEKALPEELRDEFQEVGDLVFKLSGGKMGKEKQLADDEEEKQLEEFSHGEEKKMFDRYNELAEIAKNNLKNE
jgi:hypothetical protein